MMSSSRPSFDISIIRALVMLDPCAAVGWFWEEARDKIRAAKTTTKDKD
jgi:hypothetical protein